MRRRKRKEQNQHIHIVHADEFILHQDLAAPQRRHRQVGLVLEDFGPAEVGSLHAFRGLGNRDESHATLQSKL